MNTRMRRFGVALAASAALLLSACGEDGGDNGGGTPFGEGETSQGVQPPSASTPEEGAGESAPSTGSRPSVDEIKAALTSGEVPEFSAYQQLPEPVLQCMAQALHDSEFSDDGLRAIMEGNKNYPFTQEDLEALKGFQKAGMECAKEASGQG